MDKTGEEKGQEKANEFPLNSHGIYLSPLQFLFPHNNCTAFPFVLYSVALRKVSQSFASVPLSFSSPLLRVSWFHGLNISFFTSTFLESSEEESVIDTAIFPFCITA
jgi:hypothetical protein